MFSALNQNSQDWQLGAFTSPTEFLRKYSPFEMEYSIGLLVIHSVGLVRDMPYVQC